VEVVKLGRLGPPPFEKEPRTMRLERIRVDLADIEVRKTLEEDHLMRVQAEEPVRDDIAQGNEVVALFEEVDLLESKDPHNAVVLALNQKKEGWVGRNIEDHRNGGWNKSRERVKPC